MIPGYCYKWFRVEHEELTLAETSVGTGITWSIAIKGEMKLVEEIVHRIDMIYSGTPYHILNQWLLNKTVINENFKRTTKSFYEIVEASYRAHLQLPTVFSTDLNKMDDNFFRRLGRTEEAFQELVEYNRTRHLKTSKELSKIHKKISSGYVGPESSKIFELGGSHVSYQDMLQHTILSNVVNAVLNSNRPIEALNHLAKMRKNLRYDSVAQLNQILKDELRNAGYKTLEGDELHTRIFGGYFLITQAVLTKKTEVIIETMQEVLGWLTGSAFYNVFHIDKNKNLPKFLNLHEILFSEEPSFSKCFVGKILNELAKSLPNNRDLSEKADAFSECGRAIGEALAKTFSEIENSAYSRQSECLACNDIFKRMKKVGRSNKPISRNKAVLEKATDFYGKWIFDEIFNKSNKLSQKLRELKVLD